MPDSRRRRRRSAQRAVALPRPSRRAVLTAVLALLFLAASLATFRFWTLIHRISPDTHAGDVLGLLGGGPPQPGTLAWKIAHDERVNVLLLGYGGPGHDGPYLTDSIMLVSLLPKTHQAVLVSLPRDLWVPIPAFPKREYDGKLNEAYAIGMEDAAFGKKRPEYSGRRTAGGNLAAAVVSDITGQRIDYWVGVDFKAFEDVVNALGGIDLTVDEVLHDEHFPKGETTGVTTVHFNAGRQHMDGERALQFARSRMSTNDYDRSKRQQKILLAVRQRVFTLDALPRMLGLFDALQKNVITNLTVQDLRRFGEVARGQRDEDTRRIAIDETNLLRQGPRQQVEWIVLPKDKTFDALRLYLGHLLPGRGILAEKATVQVLNGTDRYPIQLTTAAESWTDLLAATGFKMAPPADAAHQRFVACEIHDYSGGRAARTAQWLAEFFHGSVVSEAAEEPPANRVVVILGSEFTLRTFAGR